MQVVKILIPKVGLFPLDYNVSKDTKLNIGDLLEVPFRRANVIGIVWDINCTPIHKKLKVIDLARQNTSGNYYNIGKPNLELIRRTSNYYLSALGTVAKLVLPVDILEGPIKVETQKIPAEHMLFELSKEQIEALDIIKNTNKPVLLKGVTGSGKTEVYFHLIAECLKEGKQALIMLPEISLSSQIIQRFTERFGFKPAIWNSTITKATKKKLLRGILGGFIKIVIGARSSLFLPYKNLALIVVDEEHDISYKQGEGVLYHARDMAVLKANLLNSKIILVSATPSIESIVNSQQEKYLMVQLKNRFSDAKMPEVKIIDMRSESLRQNSWLSPLLIDEIKTTNMNGNQSLLFLNRRGYAPLMICKSCGYRFGCPHCSASMITHKAKKKMQCHHCGFETKIHKECPDCDVPDSLILCGPGIERIYEETIKLFPELNIKIISSDECCDEALIEMESGKIDILIGTQIITKGYHFPKLELVGVIDADIGFVGGDLRSAERTFQLLHQVGGRAGRHKHIVGRVFLQSYFPENKVLQSLVCQSEDDFISEEIAARIDAMMPPFTKMASINVTGQFADKTLSFAKNILKMAPSSSARILGPAESLMFKLSGKYRYRILIIAEKNFNIQKYISVWLNNCKIPTAFAVKVDVDPYSFY